MPPGIMPLYRHTIQVDLVKDSGHQYFIRHLEANQDTGAVPVSSKAQAAFVLAVICDDHPRGQRLCAEAGMLQACLQQLPEAQRVAQAEGDTLLLQWLLLAIGKLCENSVEVRLCARWRTCTTAYNTRRSEHGGGAGGQPSGPTGHLSHPPPLSSARRGCLYPRLSGAGL